MKSDEARFLKKKFVGKTKTTRQKPNTLICIFLLEYESINDPSTFRKKMCGKNWGKI